jgi:3-deoxy-D-manno-octulosonate 8-phosphate phosphatase (KDO 8-P phosphatase)
MDKVPVMASILERLGLEWEQAAYLGDDRGDLGVLHKVGLAACPNDAISEARAAAHLVLRAKGGEGAFRELAERILNQ